MQGSGRYGGCGGWSGLIMMCSTILRHHLVQLMVQLHLHPNQENSTDANTNTNTNTMTVPTIIHVTKGHAYTRGFAAFVSLCVLTSMLFLYGAAIDIGSRQWTNTNTNSNTNTNTNLDQKHNFNVVLYGGNTYTGLGAPFDPPTNQTLVNVTYLGQPSSITELSHAMCRAIRSYSHNVLLIDGYVGRGTVPYCHSHADSHQSDPKTPIVTTISFSPVSTFLIACATFLTGICMGMVALSRYMHASCSHEE